MQPDGVVTQVETGGGAARAGLRQGCRLVEICTVAVCTLSHDQMVDLLKTSAPVTVTVIPALGGTARGSCSGAECPGAGAGGGGQLPGRHRRRYDPSFSPPRSGTSSGYGTGSSSKSYPPPELWSPETHTEQEKEDTNKIYNKPIEPAYSSISRLDTFEPAVSAKVMLVKRHSQETISSNSFNDHRSDKSINQLQERGSASPRRGTGGGSPASGEARLRAPRPQRHSAGPSSSLQEDLMRLINPDYMEGGGGGEGVVLQARPATVISSTSSGGSPAPGPPPVPLPLPDARMMDWPSLVDTATRAMLQVYYKIILVMN